MKDKKSQEIKEAALYFINELKPAYDQVFLLLKKEELFNKNTVFDFVNDSKEIMAIKSEKYLKDYENKKNKLEYAHNIVKIKKNVLEILKKEFNGSDIKEMYNVIKQILKIEKIQNF
jgi:hypothetical protein